MCSRARPAVGGILTTVKAGWLNAVRPPVWETSPALDTTGSIETLCRLEVVILAETPGNNGRIVGFESGIQLCLEVLALFHQRGQLIHH